MTPLLAFAADFLASASHLHPRTRALYARAFTHHWTRVLADAALESLTRPLVRAAAIRLRGLGIGPAALRNSWIALSAALEHAVGLGLLNDNPAHGTLKRLIPAPRGAAALPRALTRDELAAFLAVLPSTAPHLEDLFLVLATTGLRIGEALGLEHADVDLERARLRVTRTWTERTLGPPKHGPRTIDVPPTLVSRLALRLATVPGRWLFPSHQRARPWTRENVDYFMRKACHRAGIRRATPHQLRHTYATLMLEATGDVVYVSRQLGHASVKLTCDVYGIAARPQHPEALDRLYDLATHHRPPSAAVPSSSQPGRRRVASG